VGLRTRLARYVACIECVGNSHEVLVGKPVGKGLFIRPKYRILGLYIVE
jgi:hypothetical protein